MVWTFKAFLELCYAACHHVITDHNLVNMEDALARFHHYRKVFQDEECPVVPTFLLLCQHVAKHYPELIHLFGASNGLCSSITENKHIKAVKEPWQRSNRFNALEQMLVTNQRLDKLAVAQVDFTNQGMLNGTCLDHTSIFRTIS